MPDREPPWKITRIAIPGVSRVRLRQMHEALEGCTRRAYEAEIEMLTTPRYEAAARRRSARS